MRKLLITGADGFVGRHLGAAALARGMSVRGAVRQLPAAGLDAPWAEVSGRIEPVAVGDIGGNADWTGVLAGIETVVHLAGRAHILRETAADPVAAMRRIIVEGTRRLAEAMLDSAARRLVFVSSIHVLGNATQGTPLDERSPPCPHNAYAHSKWEAEQILGTFAQKGLEVVVARPALVYGPGVKGNLLRLLRLIERGLPLPVGGVRNARSLIGVTNLCDLLLHCATDPRAAGETFVAADAVSLSTPTLVRTIARAMGRPARLLWAPPRLIAALLAPMGYGHAWQQLTGSLEVDATKSRAFFGRADPVSTEDGLAEMARWYCGSTAAR